MQLSALFAACLLTLAEVASASAIGKRAISTTLFNDLVFHFQYASSAYSNSCPSPNGNTLVQEFSIASTDTQGFIARDDNRKEIVVALRGSSSETDFLVDEEIALTPFLSQGVVAPAGTLVHTGFLTAWNSAASTVISAVRSQLSAHPGYTIVTSGHSLGGALASLAGILLQQNFPGTAVNMFTYGQPRTGNPTYAAFVDSKFGNNALRSVHTFDGVPTIIPQSLGYQHHGVQFWQTPDPASASTVRQCVGDEDPTCSDSIPSTGINAAHLVYYNIEFDTAFCT